MNNNLTAIQCSALHHALHRVWEAIASAILGDESSTVSKAEVIELVLDADRVEAFGHLSSANLSAWQALSHDERQRLAEETFTYDVYGY